MSVYLAEDEVQAALFARINVAAVKCPVYEEVPQKVPYPYINIGDSITGDGSSKGCNMPMVTMQIHGWDLSESYEKITDLMSTALNLITVSSDVPSTNFLTLTNFMVENQIYRGSNRLKDIDQKTRHVIINIEFWCKEK